MKSFTLLLLASGLAFAQTSDPAFEVASIKPSPPPDGRGMVMGCKGGPGSADPGLWRCTNATILMLITRAYGLSHYQVTAPDWVRDTHYEINATLAPDATKEQFEKMIQGLLTERFKLEFHWVKKEVPMYDLVVAKNGPKLQAHQEAKDASADPNSESKAWGKDNDGYPTIPKDCKGCMMVNAAGKARYFSSDETIKKFAEMVAAQLSKPVKDLTELTGKYDIVLSWNSGGGVSRRAEADGAASDPELTIEAAVQQQLGLKLAPKKGMMDVFVVDKAEKTPIEN